MANLWSTKTVLPVRGCRLLDRSRRRKTPRLPRTMSRFRRWYGGKMGRPERPIDPSQGPLQSFAWDLRLLRAKAGGPSYRELAQRTRFSASALSAAASGVAAPSRQVTLAYVAACDGDVDEWATRWSVMQASVALRSFATREDSRQRDGYVVEAVPGGTSDVPTRSSTGKRIATAGVTTSLFVGACDWLTSGGDGAIAILTVGGLAANSSIDGEGRPGIVAPKGPGAVEPRHPPRPHPRRRSRRRPPRAPRPSSYPSPAPPSRRICTRQAERPATAEQGWHTPAWCVPSADLHSCRREVLRVWWGWVGRPYVGR